MVHSGASPLGLTWLSLARPVGLVPVFAGIEPSAGITRRLANGFKSHRYRQQHDEEPPVLTGGSSASPGPFRVACRHSSRNCAPARVGPLCQQQTLRFFCRSGTFVDWLRTRSACSPGVAFFYSSRSGPDAVDGGAAQTPRVVDIDPGL